MAWSRQSLRIVPRPVLDALGRLRHVASKAYWRARPGIDREIFEIRPFGLVLELTNLCNANCVFCPYSQQTRSHEQMSEFVFRKAVADFAAAGGGSVDLTPTVGDPLIHPDFVDWVHYLRSIPEIDRITVTTNAILLDRHGAQRVLDSGLSRINISLAGFDEEMYRRVYRSNSYRKVRDNIAELLALNSKRPEPVTIFLCLRPDRPAKEVLADPDLKPLLVYRPNLTFLSTFSRSGGLISSLPSGMDLAPAETKPKPAPCRFTFTGLTVQSGGDVQICPCESSVNAPALVIGNIHRQSLQEIWHSEKLRALRASFTDGTLNPNCSKCDSYYQQPGFHLPGMREMAKASRRRHAGEIVRHLEPVRGEWQME